MLPTELLNVSLKAPVYLRVVLEIFLRVADPLRGANKIAAKATVAAPASIDKSMFSDFMILFLYVKRKAMTICVGVTPASNWINESDPDYIAELYQLLSLNQPEYDGNNSYDQQDMYKSPGAVADKSNGPANDQNDGYDIK